MYGFRCVEARQRSKPNFSGMLRCNVYRFGSLGSMVKVWITCFVLLFGATEGLQWVQQFSLPLPIFMLGGALLAIASNYNKLTHLPFHLDYKKPEALQDDVSAAQVPPKPQTAVQKDLPLQRDRATDHPISFTISKPHQPRG